MNEHGEPDEHDAREHDARERDEQEHDERARRAERRRRTYEGAIVRAGEPKPRLRGESFTVERLDEMYELCVTTWLASGRALPELERSAMPGEIFRIER